jgi:hypothetical protein
MIQLTTNLSDPLLELLRNGKVPVDGIEVGPWFSVQRIRDYRQALPGIPFYFHGGDLIEGVGLIPGAVSRIGAYLHCTASPWVSMHITMWLPGMVRLMLQHGWRMPLPKSGTSHAMIHSAGDKAGSLHRGAGPPGEHASAAITI